MISRVRSARLLAALRPSFSQSPWLSFMSSFGIPRKGTVAALIGRPPLFLYSSTGTAAATHSLTRLRFMSASASSPGDGDDLNVEIAELKRRLEEMEGLLKQTMHRAENAELRAEMEAALKEKERALKEKENQRAEKEKQRADSARKELEEKLRVTPEQIELAKKRGQAFIDSLMKAKYEDIPDSSGMRVLRGVQRLVEGKEGEYGIVVRSVSSPFWEACVELVNTRDVRYSVAAIGSPGIGKTSSSPLLIRTLLEKRHTVVYRICTTGKVGWYYEFVPTGSDVCPDYRVNVYPETMKTTNIPSLQREDTYHVVDPGRTKGSCLPDTDFLPKFILVTSPNSSHWGFGEFTKLRNGVLGWFKYLPLWTLQELLAAREILSARVVDGKNLIDEFTDEVVAKRFEIVGGVPRHIFTTQGELENIKAEQADALTQLTPDQVMNIVTNKIVDVDNMRNDQPKSILMGYRLAEDDNGTFSKRRAVLVSSHVEQEIIFKHAKFLWQMMTREGPHGWRYFQRYTRRLMTNEGPIQFQVRPCTGKRSKEDPLRRALGGCTETREAMDLVEAARSVPNVVFHSTDENYPLIDFIYRDEAGHFHAFQATTSKKHKAQVDLITNLEKQVGDPTKLTLYYLVPSHIFGGFVTRPADPQSDVKCQILIVQIPDPNEETFTGNANKDAVNSKDETLPGGRKEDAGGPNQNSGLSSP